MSKTITKHFKAHVALLLTAALAACAPEVPTEDAQQGVASAMKAEARLVSRPDPRNATYEVDDQSITLVNGLAEGPPAAPGSATRERTLLLDPPVFGDLDGDGDEDAVVLLTHETGGSGTFVYVAAVTQTAQGHRGSNAISLGDRIGSPEIRVVRGVVHVNFLDRPEEASFADAPSVPQVLGARLEAGRLAQFPSPPRG